MLPRVNIVRGENVDYLLFSTDDAISSTIYRAGSWAQLLTDISVYFCSGVEAPLVLDIGANLGAYSVPMAQKLLGAGGTVYAFEPQRVIYYQLCGNIFLNRLSNVHAFNSAVGRLDGSMELKNIDFQRSKNIGGFSLRHFPESGTNDIVLEKGTTKTPIVTLDSLHLPRKPCLIKIDVEGYELEVLQGAGNLLRDSDFPPLLLEAWTENWFANQRDELISHLQSIGYECFFIQDEIIAQHPMHPSQFTFSQNEDQGLTMLRIK